MLQNNFRFLLLTAGIKATIRALYGIGVIVMALTCGTELHHPELNIKLISSEENMATATTNGIIEKPSTHSVDQTVEKLKGILQAKGVTLFALVDHSGEAAKVGMKMPPTKLLIFGSPKAGTPLMLASPSVAIDLPLKILVWEDTAGKVWVSYNSPEYLKTRHSLSPELLPNIAVVETIAAKAAE